MTITVLYTTQLKAALGAAREQLEMEPPVGVRDVLTALNAQHGKSFNNLVLSADGQLLPSILLCLGDNQIDLNYDKPLEDGDVLTLLSAISGG